MNKQEACHVYVRKIAKEMAGAVYESCAKDDAFFAAYPSERAFITKAWPLYVGEARQSLVALLGSPSVHETLKEKIFDIVLKDKALQTNIFGAETAGYA